MSISSKLDQVHAQVRSNRWFAFFATFNRIALAAGFIPAGLVKITGERFTDLHNFQPMGQYLEALFHTSYYYTFIGYAQVIAAVLLLIPRTTVLGALLYFPIILNIAILSFAVRFVGSRPTAPFMVLGSLYLLCWDYHKLKFIFPFNHTAAQQMIPKAHSYAFPFRFFAGVLATIVGGLMILVNLYRIEPYNTLPSCFDQCPDTENPEACYEYCECIHARGEDLEKCLKEYKKALKK